MSAQQYIAMLCVLALPLANNALAEESELSVLRSEIDSLRADYETRIAALEGRLVAVEQAQPARLRERRRFRGHLSKIHH